MIFPSIGDFTEALECACFMPAGDMYSLPFAKCTFWASVFILAMQYILHSVCPAVTMDPTEIWQSPLMKLPANGDRMTILFNVFLPPNV